jgi:kynureninase
VKKIYRMRLDFGRNGSLTGLFVATEEQIKSIIGRSAWFGEALGKHSDCSWTFEQGEDVFEEVLSTSQIVEWFEKNVGSQGYNPFDYLRCGECNACNGDGEF